jgi:hypothetical protein
MYNDEVKETPSPVADITLPSTEEEKKEAVKLPVREVIGKLWWLALQSRPDIFCALHKCSLWQNNPSEKLWDHLMYILKYLNNTRHYGLVFQRLRERAGAAKQERNQEQEQQQNENFLFALCDSSFSNEEKSKSRYGYLFFCLGGLVSWTSSKSKRVVLSSTEAECHGLVEAGKESSWMRDFLSELSLFDFVPPTTIYQDNQSAIRLVSGGICHKRSKHFQIEFDWLQEAQEEKEIQVKYRPTKELAADLLTKSLPPSSFVPHREEMMGEAEIQKFFMLGVKPSGDDGHG